MFFKHISVTLHHVRLVFVQLVKLCLEPKIDRIILSANNSEIIDFTPQKLAHLYAMVILMIILLSVVSIRTAASRLVAVFLPDKQQCANLADVTARNVQLLVYNDARNLLMACFRLQTHFLLVYNEAV